MFKSYNSAHSRHRISTPYSYLPMNRLEKFLLIPLVIGIIILGGCSNNLWDEVPTPITSFIEQYYPGSGVSGVVQTADGGYKVTINNGATLVFDSEYSWISVDGNGVRLPEVLVYNQLPPALYNYLQGIEQQDMVFKMSRDSKFYKLTMEDTVITYDIVSGKITYPDGSSVEI